MLELANAILRRGGYSRAAALSLAWRITNRYPAALREAAVCLAGGGMPALEIAGYSLEEVQKTAMVGAFEALELMEILDQDTAAGDQLLVRLSRHDGRGEP